MTDQIIDPEGWELFKSMAEPAMLVELLDSYLDDTPQLIQQIKSGISSGEIEQVRRAAHSLKSNSASFGANRLAEITRELEMIAKAGTLAGAEQKLIEVENEYARLQPLLMELKNGL